MGFTVETGDRLQVLDVTARVEEVVPDVDRGTCTVFVHHTTAALCVNEHEPRLVADLESFLRDVVPDEGWRHDELDGNADAHLRATLLGRHVTVPVRDGALDLGTWGAILLVECDGPRTRRLSVTTTNA